MLDHIDSMKRRTAPLKPPEAASGGGNKEKTVAMAGEDTLSCMPEDDGASNASAPASSVAPASSRALSARPRPAAARDPDRPSRSALGRWERGARRLRTEGRVVRDVSWATCA